MKKLIYLVLVLFIFSCNKNDKKIQNENLFHLNSAEKISFRRNYFYPETISEKEIENLDKRNPERIGNKTNQSVFYNSLKKSKLFDKNGNLIEKKWDYFIEKSIQKGIFKVNNIEYNFDINITKEFRCFLTLSDLHNKVVLKETLTFDNPQDVGFLIKDLDEDGSDEIISFYHWYIVNGDNYDIEINKIEK